MQKTIPILIGMLSLAASASAQTRTAPYIRTMTSSRVVAPGQHFFLYVEVDNRNLDGHRTGGVQWAFIDPGVFEYVPGSVDLPATNDFFTVNTIDFYSDPSPSFGAIGGRIVSSGSGMLNRRGNVIQYEYTVPLEIAQGSYSFELNPESTFMTGGSEERQEAALYAEPVSIAEAGDANADGRVDGADLLLLAQHWMQSGLDVNSSWRKADFTFDGMVNRDDLGLMAANWGRDQGAAGMSIEAAAASAGLNLPVGVPEPGALLSTVLFGMLLRRRR